MVDLSVLEPFIKYWKTSGEFRTKLILIPELTDNQNQFILFDIKPKGVKPANSDYMQHYRFAYEYDNPRDILKGLEHFKKHMSLLIKMISIQNQSENKKKRLMKINCRKSNLHQ